MADMEMVSNTIASSKTFTYKTANSCEIKLNLYVPQSAKNVPVLLWFHGGGLLQGTRTSVAPHMLAGVRKYGYALVSADYRLAPQVSIADILTDVIDSLAFIRNDLGKHVDSGTLDTSRVVVSGSSAGGYLALLAGLYAEPKPQVVLAIYPITDPLGTFFTNSQPYPAGKVEQRDVAPYLDRNADVMAFNESDSKRGKMYGWMMQEAILADLLGVKHGDDKFIIADAIRKQGKSALPPTFVVHGDADRFVGVEQADEVVKAMKSTGITHEFERLEGLDHLFDARESVGMEKMYAFMERYV